MHHVHGCPCHWLTVMAHVRYRHHGSRPAHAACLQLQTVPQLGLSQAQLCLIYPTSIQGRVRYSTHINAVSHIHLRLLWWAARAPLPWRYHHAARNILQGMQLLLRRSQPLCQLVCKYLASYKPSLNIRQSTRMQPRLHSVMRLQRPLWGLRVLRVLDTCELQPNEPIFNILQ